MKFERILMHNLRERLDLIEKLKFLIKMPKHEQDIRPLK